MDTDVSVARAALDAACGTPWEPLRRRELQRAEARARRRPPPPPAPTARVVARRLWLHYMRRAGGVPTAHDLHRAQQAGNAGARARAVAAVLRRAEAARLLAARYGADDHRTRAQLDRVRVVEVRARALLEKK